MNAQTSPAEQLAHRLVASMGPASHRAMDLALAQLTTTERAALAYHWPFWARPKQLVPAGTTWRSFGIMSGRGFGKTLSLAQFVTEEIRAGRAGRVAVCAPTASDTRDIMVEGKSGLLSIAPPWFRPKFEPGNGRLIYPNGAQAFLYTASEPEHFRGPEHDLFWGDELGSWPKETWEAAWSNMRMGLRLGLARLVWSTTPRPVPLVVQLVARAKKDPEKHVIVRGSTLENRANLPQHFIEEMLGDYAGTRLGQQELDGELLEDVPGAIFHLGTIAAHRRRLPDSGLKEVGIAVDPAITTRRGSDQTGIVVGGVGFDGHVYILADYSGKHTPERWGQLVIDAARQYRASFIVGEQNRGGQLVAANVRALERALRAEGRLPVGWALPPLEEVHARTDKRGRAEPIATLYEKGRVSHLVGADLAELERQMTTWDPTAQGSPDRLDALVHLVWRLARVGERVFSEEYSSVAAASRIARPQGHALDDDDGELRDAIDDDDARMESRL